VDEKDVVSYGLDYIRFQIYSETDVEYVQREFSYLDINSVYHHGSRFIDLTGGMLEVVRMMDDLEEKILLLAYRYPVHRLDVYIDVQGYSVDQVETEGNSIWQGKKVETVYSHRLEQRGNVPVFGRCYDAEAAGHYNFPVTRYEIEFHKDLFPALLSTGGWSVNPISVAIHYVKKLFDVDLVVPEHTPLEFKAPKRKYASTRESFYRRYGKGILIDIAEMGAHNLENYIRWCYDAKD